MGSSSGFGSTPCDMRPIQTRFRCGSACHWLNRTTEGNSPDHTPKGTPSGRSEEPGPSTACKHTVSGSISLPSPGYFSPFPHGTVRYRSLRVFSLGAWSPQLHTGFLVSGATQELIELSRASLYRAITVYGGPFQILPLKHCALLGCSAFARRYLRNLG